MESECVEGTGGSRVQESAYQQPAPEVLMGTAAPGTETMSVSKLYGPQMTGRDGVVGLGVEKEGSIASLSLTVPAPPLPQSRSPTPGPRARMHRGPCLPEAGEQGSSR